MKNSVCSVFVPRGIGSKNVAINPYMTRMEIYFRQRAEGAAMDVEILPSRMHAWRLFGKGQIFPIAMLIG